MKKTNLMIAGMISIMSLIFMGFWLPTDQKHEQMTIVAHKSTKALDQQYLQAVGRGDLGSIRKALEQGANINAVDENHYSALHLIALRKRPNYQKYAISAANEIFFEIEEGKWESAEIIKAQEQKFYRVLDVLLEAGIDTVIQDYQGLFARDLAAQNNDYIMVRRIIDAENARKEAQAKAK